MHRRQPEGRHRPRRAFLHPALRFAVTFPDGWEVHNAPEQVVAQAPGDKQLMVLQQATPARGASLADAARRQMKSAGFTFVDGQDTTVNGLEAFRGVYRGSLHGVGKVLGRAVHVRNGRQIYMLVGFAPEAEFDRVAPQNRRLARQLPCPVAQRSGRCPAEPDRHRRCRGRRHVAGARAALRRDRRRRRRWP